MTAETAPAYRWQQWSPTRACAVWLGLVLAFAIGWGLLVAVPYYVNDLHHLPLAEVASGAHDPKDLWPYASEPNVILGLARAVALLLVIPFTPFVAIGSAIGGTALLARRWRSLTTGARRLAVAVVVVSLALAAVTLSPFGQALRTWALD